MQIEFLLWVQSWSSPVWDGLFKGITALGSDGIYIVYVAALYWCIDKKAGEKWAYLILSSALLNGIVKLSFLAPRPFEAGVGIIPVDTSTATGHSFPSGHSQASAVFGGFLAMENKARRIKAAGVLIFLSIGLSRLYLRVHWPIDVLAGWTLGLSIALVYHLGYDRYPAVFKMIGFCLFIVTALWFRDEDQIKLMGLFLASMTGIWFSNHWLDLPIHGFGRGGKRKLGFGILVIILTMAGLKAVLPESLNMLRYGLVGLTLTLIYPWLFALVYEKLYGRRSRRYL